jgi:3-phenylpropionate/trans-cinnamate dioxygenase ferredoxin reductase subunit
MSHHVRYLLLGGGLASSAAAEAIRALDREGEVMLVGQEITRPYHRPPLSKEFLRGLKSREELFTLKPGWFASHQIELRTGERASLLDTTRRTVTLGSGEAISFDKLLIATGASAAHLQTPGAELPNVYYLRTLADADRLHHAIGKAQAEGRAHPRGRGRACIIGGGVLGVELAATLTQLGLAIDLIETGPHPWSKFAGESTGRFMARLLEQRGANVHVNAHVVKLEGDGRVQRVQLSASAALATPATLPCDFVVACVGAVANKDLLRDTPITAEHAILVDEHCRTSVPDIYAAGDCAALFDPLFGKHRVLDHWNNALLTGALAGKNMAGADVRYDAVNTFFSDVFELTLNAWGAARLVERRLMRGTPNVESSDFVEIGVAKDGRVAQVLAVGHAGENDVLCELVRRRLSVEGIEESLKDPTTKLADLLR